jgi:3-oxoacyl-[acyl-carrier-protein] synthase II
MTDSQVVRSQVDSTRFGIEFGSSLIPTELDDLIAASEASYTGTPGDIDLLKWGSESIPRMNPLWMLKYLPNMAACHTSIIHDAQGPNNSVTQSDAAGLSRMVLFAHLSKNPDPAKASRPFDKNRDGTVIAEGVGVFVLEELEHAKKRNAKIYAELVGFASAFDKGMTGSGLARCIRSALNQAGIAPVDVDHVNAHGMSDVDVDAWEARGINEVFGKSTTVFAPKSYLGNTVCAGGTVELTASLLAMQHGTLPGTLNFETPDPACPVAVTSRSRPIAKPWFVKVSLTEKGQCAAAVLKKWKE